MRGLKSKGAQYLLTQPIGAPWRIWTGNDPNGFEKVRTEQQNSADSYLDEKSKGINSRAYTEARGLAWSSSSCRCCAQEGTGAPERGPLITTHNTQVNKSVSGPSGLPGGRDLSIPIPIPKGVQKSPDRMTNQTHTHTHTNTHTHTHMKSFMT